MLTKRGRALGVVVKGIEITSSVLRAELPGMGMLVERDVLELMVVVEVASVRTQEFRTKRKWTVVGGTWDSQLVRLIDSGKLNQRTRMSRRLLVAKSVKSSQPGRRGLLETCSLEARD